MLPARHPGDPRPISEVRQALWDRIQSGRNPFPYTSWVDVEAALGRLPSTDRDLWAETFSALARPHEEWAAAAEAAGDTEQARASHLAAYDYYHLARYPAPNSPGKLRAYRRAQEHFLQAARSFNPPLERVEIPFRARSTDRGTTIIGYLRTPSSAPRTGAPLVVQWGGIDGFKEDRNVEPYLAAGLPILALDMPGVGDAPLVGAPGAERQWDDVFDWVATRPEFDADRVGVVGGSTGGYWATRLAHTHRHRVRAAVNHGGPAHFAFSEEWIARAQFGEYPLELAQTLASAFGLSTYDEWVAFAPRLSLLESGLLDEPSASLLLVNGVADTIFPIQDMHLLLDHGAPKSARFFPGPHMGGPEAVRTIVAWLQHQLA